MNVGDRLGRKNLSVRCCIVIKKIKKMDFVSDFSVARIKLNYGEIFFFLNKLKFDDSNICKRLLVREQKIINSCPSDKLISLKLYV